MTRPFAKIAQEVWSHTLERFKRQTGPDGVPWQRRKKDSDPARAVLFKSGDLYDAIDPDHGADFAAVGVIGSGGPARYGARHQFGGGGIPARPFLGIEERDLSAVEQIILSHLRSAADGGAGVGASSGLGA